MIGLVWFRQLAMNPLNLFIYHHGTQGTQDYAFDQSIHFEHVIQACVGVMLKGSLFDML